MLNFLTKAERLEEKGCMDCIAADVTVEGFELLVKCSLSGLYVNKWDICDLFNNDENSN